MYNNDSGLRLSKQTIVKAYYLYIEELKVTHKISIEMITIALFEYEKTNKTYNETKGIISSIINKHKNK